MSPPRILPAYAAETRIVDLRTAELFVIHLARLWTARHDDPKTRTPAWRQGFVVAGVEPAGAAAFDAFMRIVHGGAVAPLDIRCPTCPRLGADEGRVLQAVSLLQHGRPAEAAIVLGDWLGPAAVRAAEPQVGAFAAALAKRGLAVPARRVPVVPPGDLRIPANAGRGLSLVH